MRAHLLAECRGVSSANAIIDHTVTHRKWQDRGASGGERCNGEWRCCTMCCINHHALSGGTHSLRKRCQGPRIAPPILLGLSCV